MTCTEIVNAHSVQKSGPGLTAIARAGHVYGYKLDFSLLDRTGGRVEPRLIGIREASTFTGFCGIHDSQTFRAIETETFAASGEQVALLGYRAICKELMAKASSIRLNPFLREGDKGFPELRQLLWQGAMDGQLLGFTLAVKDLEYAKDQFESAITTQQYSEVRSLVIEFDKAPSVLTTSALTPEFDFNGRLLQDLSDVDSIMHVVTFSLIGTGDGRGAAVFSWMGDSQVGDALSASVQEIPPENLPHRLVQFAFEYFENVYWSPEWWDGLDSDTKSLLLDRMNAQVRTIRGPDCLRDDGTRSATWTVTRAFRA